MEQKHYIVIALTVVVLIVLIVVTVYTLDTKKNIGIGLGLGENAPASGVLPGNLPVPGIRYSKQSGQAVSNVQAMYWKGIPEPSLNVASDAPLTADQLRPVFAGEMLWNPLNLKDSLTWLLGNSGTPIAAYAVCPPGMVVTGLRVYVDDDSGNASDVNVHCQSPLNTTTNNNNTLGQILDARSGTPVNVTEKAFNDFFGQGLYLTAVNAVNGTTSVNQGFLLEDQSNTGLPPPDGYTTPNPVNPAAFSLLSEVNGSQSRFPYKPTGVPGTAPDGTGDGQNIHPDISMTFLFYQYGDPPDAKPTSYTKNLWEMNWTPTNHDSSNNWTYTSDDPFTGQIRFDPNRTIKLTYDNGGPATIKGLALANNGAKAPNGGVDDNKVTTWYYSDPPNMPNSEGYTYSFSFGHNKRSGDDNENYVIRFNLPSTGPPANRFWVLPNNNKFDQTATYQQAASTARLVVTDPTCTGVSMSFDDKGNPINVQNVGDGNGVSPLAEAVCNQRAIQLCKTSFDSDDPYCACINAQSIPGLSAIGINEPKRCLSNGDCMGADPSVTWMDYTHADVATKCEKLAVDVCAFLWNLSAETIVLSNVNLQCTNTSGRCPDCDSGDGPCKSMVPYQGHIACRSRQPDGTCGAGFVDCDPSSGNTQKVVDSLANKELADLIAGGIIVLVLIFVPVWMASFSAKKRVGA